MPQLRPTLRRGSATLTRAAPLLGTVVRGPVTPKTYAAPLGVTPALVNLGAKGAAQALKALRPVGSAQ